MRARARKHPLKYNTDTQINNRTMKGRKPLSKEVLNLRGTYRPDRGRPDSTILQPIKVEEVGQRCQIPGLQAASERARSIYWNLTKQLAVKGMLEESYCFELYYYAVEYDHFISCTESIKREGYTITEKGKDGSITKVQNPAVRMRDNAVQILNKIGSNFGFSPVDRQRLRFPLDSESQGKTLTDFIAAVCETE